MELATGVLDELFRVVRLRGLAGYAVGLAHPVAEIDGLAARGAERKRGVLAARLHVVLADRTLRGHGGARLIIERVTTPQQALDALAAKTPYPIGVFAERLEGGETLALAERDRFPAASTLKIAIVLEAFCRIHDLGARIVLRDEDKVRGSGVLASLDAGATFTLRDLVTLTSTISDNTAANLLLGQVGLANVNERLAGLGLETRFRGRIFVAGEDGETSSTTPRELVRLLLCIARADGLPPAACEATLALLARTHTASTIGRGLPDTRFDEAGPVKLAHKTGSIVGVVADAGIVRTPNGAYAVALMSRDVPDRRPNHDNAARIALGEASRIVFGAFG